MSSISESTWPDSAATVAMRKQDYAYMMLRGWLLDGSLQPGSTLDHLEIAERLNVSSVPLRQAFHRLLGEGLLEHEPHMRWRVAPLTRSNLRDVYVAREAIERILTAETAHRASDTDIAHLRELYSAHRNAVDVGNGELAREADRRFHDAMFEHADLPQCLSIYRNLRNLSDRYIIIYMRDKQRMHTSVQEHNAILSALEAKDAEVAGSAASSHVANGYKVLDGILSAEGREK